MKSPPPDRTPRDERDAAPLPEPAAPLCRPFALRYHEVRRVDWESCARVLADDARRRSLSRWASR